MKHVVTELTLDNGAKGLLIHIPGATVMSYELNFRAGEYLVERKKWETPHLMEHVLLGANELFPRARMFQSEFEKNGAYSNASTGTYDITYEAECADFEWQRILDLLLTAIARPLFLEEEFTAEFGNVREELTARSNNHFRHLSLALREQYGFAVMTDQERLKMMDNVSVTDITEHYQATHTSSNLRFVIAGKITAARQKAIQSRLSSIALPDGETRLELPDEPVKRITAPLFIANQTIDNIYFYIDTFLSRRLNDGENDSLNLINSMLTETLYSRILGTARERGLVYHMSSGIGQTKSNTNWWFGAQILPDNAEALFQIIITELSRVFSGDVALKDIRAAKQYALGRHQRSQQTVGGTAAGYSYRYFFDEAIDDYYKIPKRIRNITRQGIVDVSKDLFSENIWGMGVLGGKGSEELANKLHKKVRPLWRNK
jgi:predicted Zn-dependent peptidase